MLTKIGVQHFFLFLISVSMTWQDCSPITMSNSVLGKSKKSCSSSLKDYIIFTAVKYVLNVICYIRFIVFFPLITFGPASCFIPILSESKEYNFAG